MEQNDCINFHEATSLNTNTFIEAETRKTLLILVYKIPRFIKA